MDIEEIADLFRTITGNMSDPRADPDNTFMEPEDVYDMIKELIANSGMDAGFAKDLWIDQACSDDRGEAGKGDEHTFNFHEFVKVVKAIEEIIPPSAGGTDDRDYD